MSEYDVNAWCTRPFIANMRIEAESPEEALTKAREQVNDAECEECNEQYPWDEFEVYGDDGKSLLHVENDSKRMAAIRYLQELGYAIFRVAGEEFYYAKQGEAA